MIPILVLKTENKVCAGFFFFSYIDIISCLTSIDERSLRFIDDWLKVICQVYVFSFWGTNGLFDCLFVFTNCEYAWEEYYRDI